MSPVCKSVVTADEIAAAADIDFNPRFAKYCADDIATLCPDMKAVEGGVRDGGVIACMVDARMEVKSSVCLNQIRHFMVHAANDIRLEVETERACQEDEQLFCSDINVGQGRIHDCLRQYFDSLSEACKQEEFNEQIRESMSVETKPLIARACRKEIRELCRDYDPAAEDGQVLACLRDNRGNSDKMGAACRHQVVRDMIFVTKDYRLKPQLYSACYRDVSNLCYAIPTTGAASVLAVGPGAGGSVAHGAVIDCLIENKEKLQSLQCAKAVQKEMQTEAEDVRLDDNVNRPCQADIGKFCRNVEPGRGRVQDCLRKNFDHLSAECQAADFQQQRRQAEGGVDLQVAILSACRPELRKLCPRAGAGAGDDPKDVAASSRAQLRCLRRKKRNPSMSSRCRDAVLANQISSSKNINFNPDLLKACGPYVMQFCGDVVKRVAKHGDNTMRDDPHQFGFTEMTVMGKGALAEVMGHGGEVLQCMIEHKDDIPSVQCGEQLLDKEKDEASDVRLDPDVAGACSSDISQWCPGVEPGLGRIHRCLRKHIASLSLDCRVSEFREEKREAQDVRLNPMLVMSCKGDIAKFCTDIAPGKGRVLRCLRSKAAEQSSSFSSGGGDKGSLSEQCQAQVRVNLVSVSKNIAFNPALMSTCEGELRRMCVAETAAAEASAFKGAALQCMVENYWRIQDLDCASEVFKLVQRQEDDIKLSAAIDSACSRDEKTFCSDVANGLGRVHECLREHMEELSSECRAAEFAEFQVVESDARLHPAVRRSCKAEMKGMCKNIPAGRHAMYGCLADHLQDVGMSSACRGAVTANELLSAEDLRLNPTAYQACQADLKRLCGIHPNSTKKSVKAGTMRGDAQRCLLQKYGSIASPDCSKEIAAMVTHQMSVPRAIPDFVERCGADADALCSHVATAGGDYSGVIGDARKSSGEGHTIGCLHDNVAKLRRPCAQMLPLLLKRSKIASDLALERAASLAGNAFGLKGGAASVAAALAAARGAAGAAVAAIGQGENPASGIVITGNLAAAALCSLVVLVFGVVVLVYRSFRHETKGYRVLPKVHHAENMRKRNLQA